MGVDARSQDPRVERFGDVVIGTDLEADHLIGLGRAPCEHDHRAHDPLPPQLEDDLRAADVGQHPVDEHQVRSTTGAKLDRLRAVGRFEDFVALQPAYVGDQRSNVGVVLDDEDAVLAPAGE